MSEDDISNVLLFAFDSNWERTNFVEIKNNVQEDVKHVDSMTYLQLTSKIVSFTQTLLEISHLSSIAFFRVSHFRVSRYVIFEIFFLSQDIFYRARWFIAQRSCTSVFYRIDFIARTWSANVIHHQALKVWEQINNEFSQKLHWTIDRRLRLDDSHSWTNSYAWYKWIIYHNRLLERTRARFMC